jgi:hypothetical protein
LQDPPPCSGRRPCRLRCVPPVFSQCLTVCLFVCLLRVLCCCVLVCCRVLLCAVPRRDGRVQDETARFAGEYARPKQSDAEGPHSRQSTDTRAARAHVHSGTPPLQHSTAHTALHCTPQSHSLSRALASCAAQAHAHCRSATDAALFGKCLTALFVLCCLCCLCCVCAVSVLCVRCVHRCRSWPRRS